MKERGMVKWQPFASLPEQGDYINKLIYKMNKIERPILSEDKLNELNQTLFRCYENKEMIRLEYYFDGYIYIVEGIIVKIDTIKKNIIMENNNKREKFSVVNIIDIELM